MNDHRIRAWIAHTAAIQYTAGERATRGHNHRDGWEHCPICATPSDYTRCGLDDCEICA